MSISRVDNCVNKPAPRSDRSRGWRGAIRRLRVACVVVTLAFVAAPARAEVSQKLRAALLAPSPKVRIVAISALGQSKDPEARTLLEPLLTDPDATVRTAVVDALGRVGDPAALPALARLKGDRDATVQSVLSRVVSALESSRVLVFVGKGEDFSGSVHKSAAAELRAKTRAAIAAKLGPTFVLHEDASKKSFGASPIAIRSIVKRTEGRNTFVDVKCELTLVEMPTSILRAALATTASVGVEGPLNPPLEAELVRDGIDACAPSLASDFASYVRERSRR